jgi:anti-sigma regulatory factor (Ser/Thr protein kinase)
VNFAIPITLDVHHQAEVGSARQLAMDCAESLGFPHEVCARMALVASELATNLVKHAHGGQVVLTPLNEDDRKGLQIETLDNGPGIADINEALTDGFSTSGSCGYGLGSVNRLMDELDIRSQRNQGTHVTCRKWLRDYSRSTLPCPVDIGVASRPKPGFDLNGDDFVIQRWEQCVLVGVIDGLGHGEPAHKASKAARVYVENHFDQPLARIFAGTGFACRGTRGCVMALALLDWGRGTLQFASIGNIEARVISRSGPLNFNVRRGIIGLNAPEPMVTHHDWEPENLLLLHSDGIPTHWSWEDLPELTEQPASEVARGVLRALAKDIDDATALVLKQASHDR